MSTIEKASEIAEKAHIAVDTNELWLKACFVDRGPTKHRSRMRPAPQGRAFRERRHFCHITILVSSDKQDGEAKVAGKLGAKTTPAVSKRAKRGGAAAAPRARRTGPKTEAESGEKKVAAPKKEAKGEKKAAAKPGKAAGRKKTEE